MDAPLSGTMLVDVVEATDDDLVDTLKVKVELLKRGLDELVIDPPALPTLENTVGVTSVAVIDAKAASVSDIPIPLVVPMASLVMEGPATAPPAAKSLAPVLLAVTVGKELPAAVVN